MKAEEVIDMFRHYRHDFMNDLQLIHGYASMENFEKVKEKIQDILEKSNEERKMSNLNCPHLTLWVMNFNSTYNQFRLRYEVNIEKEDFSPLDLAVKEACEEIMLKLHNHVSKERLYNGELVIYENNGPKIRIVFNGPFNEIMEVKDKLTSIEFVTSVNFSDEDCEITLSVK